MKGIEDFDLNLLVALDVLLEEQNMARATRRLRVSRQTLTRRLNVLREKLGDKLLTPSQSGMVLTERARELQTPLRNALESIRASLIPEDVSAYPSLSGTITLSASDYALETVVAPLVGKVSKAAPNLILNIISMDHSKVRAQLDSGEVDIAICSSRFNLNAIHSRLLFKDRFRLVARRNHPSVREGLSVDTYRNLGRVVYQPIGREPMPSTSHTKRFRPRVLASSPSFANIKHIVTNSDLVALIPNRLIRNDDKHLQSLEPPEKLPIIPVSINWHECSHTNSTLRWVCDELMDTSSAVH